MRKTAAALTLALAAASAESGDLLRSSFYTSLHAGNIATTEWALKADGTSESHNWLGMDKPRGRLIVHSAAAAAQILLDHELSKPKHPRWQVWTLRLGSIAVLGWAMEKDLKAGQRGRLQQKP